MGKIIYIRNDEIEHLSFILCQFHNTHEKSEASKKDCEVAKRIFMKLEGIRLIVLNQKNKEVKEK